MLHRRWVEGIAITLAAAVVGISACVVHQFAVSFDGEADPGALLEHAGSKDWWYALAVLDSARDEAFPGAANVGGDRGAAACQEAIAVLRSKRR